MSNYRRFHVPGATYYFELCLEDDSACLLTDHIIALRAAWRKTLAELPFDCRAVVVLPNKLHAIWRLPAGDSDYSERLRLIKFRFSKALPGVGTPTASMIRKRERGIWQRRFWEHMIRDDADLALHLDICRNSPVVDGWAFRLQDWPYTSLKTLPDVSTKPITIAA